MKQRGPLLAQGRDADIFEYGTHSVLRRSRGGRSMADEAKVMNYVGQLGFPVPAVEEMSADGSELVMERINGVSMVDHVRRRPWALRAAGRTLGRLHRQLHDLDAPPWLAPAATGDGGSLVHLDFHPDNVLMADRGPVVIDWANARRGDAGVDVALTWILVAAGQVPSGRLWKAVMGGARRQMIAGLFSAVDIDDARAHLRAAVTWKVADPNMSALEQQRMWELVERAEGVRDEGTTAT